MSARRTELVTELPIEDLKVGLSLVKGEKVGAQTLALAAENILSYAASQFLPAEIPLMGSVAVMAGSSVDQSVAIAAFEEVLPDAQGTMKAGVTALPWKTILKTLLPFILNLL